ncbi:MAG: GTP-binding protein, partial [Pseudomonadota bacterium]
RHDDHISAFCIASDLAISAPSFDLFLELLRSYHGPNLLRVKGIVKIEEDPERPFIIHGVQHVFHPPVQLDAWPDDDKRSRLVFITRDVQKAELEKIFMAFADRSQGAGAAFRDDTLSLRSGGLLEE